MKRLIMSLFLVASLTACGSVPDKEYVYETKYITRVASPELKSLPSKADIIDTIPSTEVEAAVWLVNVGKYIDLLEGKFVTLIEFYERPVDE